MRRTNQSEKNKEFENEMQCKMQRLQKINNKQNFSGKKILKEMKELRDSNTTRLYND